MQTAVHCGFTGFPTASGNHLNGCWGRDRFIWKVNTALWLVTKEHALEPEMCYPLLLRSLLVSSSWFFFFKKPFFSDQLLNFSSLWIGRASESALGMLHQRVYTATGTLIVTSNPCLSQWQQSNGPTWVLMWDNSIVFGCPTGWTVFCLDSQTCCWKSPFVVSYVLVYVWCSLNKVQAYH